MSRTYADLQAENMQLHKTLRMIGVEIFKRDKLNMLQVRGLRGMLPTGDELKAGLSDTDLQTKNAQLKETLEAVKEEAATLERNAIEDISSMGDRIDRLVAGGNTLRKELTVKGRLNEELIAHNEVLIANNKDLRRVNEGLIQANEGLTSEIVRLRREIDRLVVAHNEEARDRRVFSLKEVFEEALLRLPG